MTEPVSTSPQDEAVPGGDGEPAPAPSTEERPRHRRQTRRWAALAVGVAVLSLVAVIATRPPAATRAVRSPLVGKPAPEISGQTIDGETVSLADYRGQWVLINIFATWCVPCRQEHPELIEFRDRHRSLGDAEVIAIVFSDSAPAVRDFRTEHGGDWPMLVDPDGRMALTLGVSGVPESFLVDPQGVIVSKIVGGVRAGDLDALLAQAKAQAGPTAKEN